MDRQDVIDNRNIELRLQGTTKVNKGEGRALDMSWPGSILFLRRSRTIHLMHCAHFGQICNSTCDSILIYVESYLHTERYVLASRYDSNSCPEKVMRACDFIGIS